MISRQRTPTSRAVVHDNQPAQTQHHEGVDDHCRSAGCCAQPLLSPSGWPSHSRRNGGAASCGGPRPADRRGERGEAAGEEAGREEGPEAAVADGSGGKQSGAIADDEVPPVQAPVTENKSDWRTGADRGSGSVPEGSLPRSTDLQERWCRELLPWGPGNVTGRLRLTVASKLK